MKNPKTDNDPAYIRKKAEKVLQRKTIRTGSKLSEAEILKLVHELEVHQIELEMLNSEST